MEKFRRVAPDEKVSGAAIAAQLRRIEASPQFARAPRLRQLLQYLVENSYDGRDRDLQEFTVGAEVFGRGERFDPQTDAIVRVTARRLRRVLAAYYRGEGKDDPIRFAIPTGHYRVEFSPTDQDARTEIITPGPPPWLMIPAACLLLAAFAATEYRDSKDPAVAAAANSQRSGDKAGEHYLVAKRLLHRRGPGDLERAVEEFELAVAGNPNNVDALVGLAWALDLSTWRTDQAYAKDLPRQYWALHKALAIDPSHPEALLRLSRVHRRAGDSAGATHYLDQALNAPRKSNLVLSALAGIEREAGDLQAAIELLREANKHPPLDVATFQNLGYMLYEAGDLEGAMEVLHQTDELFPTAQNNKVMIAKALILQGRLDEAAKFLVDPSSGAPRLQVLALYHHALGNDDASATALDRLAQTPVSFDSLTLQAEVLAFTGRYEHAMDAIETAYEILLQNHGERVARGASAIRGLLNSPYLAPLAEHSRYRAWASRAEADIAESDAAWTLAALTVQSPPG